MMGQIWSSFMNILISILYLLITFSITLLVHKYCKKEGMFIWICISVIISNIQSVKIIEICGMTTVLGNIAYANVFLATDILNETEGDKVANKSVLYSFLSMIAFMLLMWLSLLFVPSELDVAQSSLENIFNFVPRIGAASILAYLVSQFLDVYIFKKLKQKYDKLWLSNNASTIVSQLVDTIIFIVVAYVGTMPFGELCIVMLTTYLIKVIIALADTAFVYIAVKNNKVKKGEK